MSITTISGATRSDTIPIGTILAWSNSTAPTNWVLCNGQELAIATYPELYETITGNGVTFPFGANTNGSGAAGSTHFRVPDLRSRLIRTPNTTTPPSGANSNVGVTGGNATNTHTHTFTSTVNVNDATGGGHNHSSVNTGTDAPGLNNVVSGANIDANGGGSQPLGGSGSAKGMSFYGHGHNGAYNYDGGGHGGHGHGVNTSNTTSDGAHNHPISQSSSFSNTPTAVDHRPPYIEINYILFTGVA